MAQRSALIADSALSPPPPSEAVPLHLTPEHVISSPWFTGLCAVARQVVFGGSADVVEVFAHAVVDAAFTQLMVQAAQALVVRLCTPPPSSDPCVTAQLLAALKQLTEQVEVASIVLRDVARKGQGSKGSVPGVLEPAAAVKQAVALMAAMTPELPKIIRSRNAAAKTLKLTTAVLNLAATMQGLVVSVHCAEAEQQAVLVPDAGSEGGQQAPAAVSEGGEGGQAQLPGEGDAGSDNDDSPVDPEERLVAVITQLKQALQADAVQQVMAAGDDASHKAQLVVSVRQLVMQVQSESLHLPGVIAKADPALVKQLGDTLQYLAKYMQRVATEQDNPEHPDELMAVREAVKFVQGALQALPLMALYEAGDTP